MSTSNIQLEYIYTQIEYVIAISAKNNESIYRYSDAMKRQTFIAKGSH